LQVNLKDDLLLAEDDNGLTAWNIAVEDVNIEILETLRILGREVPVNHKNDLLIPKGFRH